MNQFKLIFTDEQGLRDLFLRNFSFQEKKIENTVYYEGKLNQDEEDKTIFVYAPSFLDISDLLFENFLISKITFLAKSERLDNYEMQEGDIMFPNTFLGGKDSKPIFVEYAVAENYDLSSFGIFFNGVCVQEKNDGEYSGDIIHPLLYSYLEETEKKGMIESALCVTVCENETGGNNMMQILPLIV